jgi:hypothetical protein
LRKCRTKETFLKEVEGGREECGFHCFLFVILLENTLIKKNCRKNNRKPKKSLFLFGED